MRDFKHAVLKRMMGRILLSLGLVLLSLPAAAAPADPGFQKALPGYAYQFPRDFFSHDDFRIEWWYYTGNLEAADGRAFGYQLTFFRVALAPGVKKAGQEGAGGASRWSIEQVYFAHMTVSDLEGEQFYFFERINRPALGQAGAASDQLKVWNENWSLTGESTRHRLQAKEKGTGLDLELQAVKPLVMHGKAGVSQKGAEKGNASHYFSFTRMQTEGTVWIRGTPVQVTGTSWMDHEFSSNQLSAEQIGWDWFSLKLEDGSELMLYQIRLQDGKVDPHSSGTWVGRDGTSTHLKRGTYEILAKGKWTSPHSGIVYPSHWTLILPQRKLELTIEPDLEDQELFNLRSISRSYWEGSVSVTGVSQGKPVKGKGYVELVGYGKGLREQLPDEVGASSR